MEQGGVVTKRGLFRHGELHLVVLALLEREPMHGYQLMGELARLFAPDYRPSPGSVYPCVEALAESGLIASADGGARRIYRLTPVGSEALSRRLHELVVIESRTGVRIGGSGDVDAALDRFTARVRAAAPFAPLDTILEILDDTATRIEVSRPDGASDVTTVKGTAR
jgi:DNA-binding PadR family transcriptional regulator